MSDDELEAMENGAVFKEGDERSADEKVKDFSDLIKKIEGVDDKNKQLWKEIYENSITDRQNAFAMFVKLVNICGSKTTEHAVHGRTMAVYLERMSKANDQLLRLADLISRSDPANQPIDSDDMFAAIKKR